jgi:hypothetical protein
MISWLLDLIWDRYRNLSNFCHWKFKFKFRIFFSQLSSIVETSSSQCSVISHKNSIWIMELFMPYNYDDFPQEYHMNNGIYSGHNDDDFPQEFHTNNGIIHAIMMTTFHQNFNMNNGIIHAIIMTTFHKIFIRIMEQEFHVNNGIIHAIIMTTFHTSLVNRQCHILQKWDWIMNYLKNY